MTQWEIWKSRQAEGPELCRVCERWRSSGLRHLLYNRFVCSICVNQILKSHKEENVR